MTPTALFAIAIIVTSLVIGVAVVVAVYRRQEREGRGSAQLIASFTQVMDRLGQRERDDEGELLDSRWRILRDGRTHQAGYDVGGRGPPKFWIWTELEQAAGGESSPFRAMGKAVAERPPRLRLRRETRRDRLGKALGLNRELQAGDEAFDDAIYVECDDPPDLAAPVLASPQVRRSGRALVELGCDHVSLTMDGHPLSLRWSGAQKENPFREARLDDAITELGRFAEELPAFSSVEAPSDWPRGSGLLAATIVGGVVGFSLTLLGSHVYQPLSSERVVDWGLAGLTLAIAVGVVTGLRVRGTSRALRMLGWTLGVGLMAWPLLLAGAVMTANGALDGPTEPRSVVVLRRYVTKNKSSKSHWVELRPWPPHDRVRLRISGDDYVRLAPGSARMFIGQGALSIEWYDGVAPEP